MQKDAIHPTLLIVIFMLSLMNSGSASAAPPVPDVQIGRYRTVPARATKEQETLIVTPVTVVFPETVQTVAEAIRYVLRDSGFQMADEKADSGAMTILKELPLPGVHRTLGPMTLEQALTVLAGPGFQLVIDPVHRLIGFELSPLGQAITEHPAIAAAPQKDGSPPDGIKEPVQTPSGQGR